MTSPVFVVLVLVISACMMNWKNSLICLLTGLCHCQWFDESFALPQNLQSCRMSKSECIMCKSRYWSTLLAAFDVKPVCNTTSSAKRSLDLKTTKLSRVTAVHWMKCIHMWRPSSMHYQLAFNIGCAVLRSQVTWFLKTTSVVDECLSSSDGIGLALWPTMLQTEEVI